MQIRVAVDIQDGIYVHATGGDRTRYQPPDWLGRRVSASEAMHEMGRQFGARQFYLADLDGIGGRSVEVAGRYRTLTQDTWLDLGVRSLGMWQEVSAQVDLPLILATETVGQSQWRELLRCLRYDDVVSVDCRGPEVQFADGLQSLAECHFWLGEVPVGIRVLYLGLDRVGSRGGPDWDAVRLLRQYHPRVWIGGGIRGRQDLERAESLQVEGVVVATALFDGLISLSSSATGLATRESPRLNGQ